jgi:mRNA-degrading endonuclease RelE of RelBE toxin-antitoxin system
VSFAVVWHPPATRDLLDIKWQDAAWIVREVNKLAEDGVGDVRSEVLPAGARVFFLVLPGIRIVVTFDRLTRIVHVWSVWRSIRPVGS